MVTMPFEVLLAFSEFPSSSVLAYRHGMCHTHGEVNEGLVIKYVIMLF